MNVRLVGISKLSICECAWLYAFVLPCDGLVTYQGCTLLFAQKLLEIGTIPPTLMDDAGEGGWRYSILVKHHALFVKKPTRTMRDSEL